MTAIYSKGFNILYVEAEYSDIGFYLVTCDGYYSGRFTAPDRETAIKLFTSEAWDRES